MGTETHAFMCVMVETHVIMFVMVFAGRHVASATQMLTVDLKNIKVVLVKYHTCLKYYCNVLLNCKITFLKLSVVIKGHLQVLSILHGPKHLTVYSLLFLSISINMVWPYVKQKGEGMPNV